MEDAADAVVPLRPGFDVQVRGFNRKQVIDHIELLEDQLRMVTIDRNEAVALNTDLRRLCESTRQDLDEAEQRLKRIESSDTGLPAASQRVQNMLANAEEEVQTLREQTKRQAETIRGTAETEARQLVDQAEQAATELRAECQELVTDVEARQAQLRRERGENLRDLHEREHRLRQTIRDEYKRMIALAEQEVDELWTHIRRQCEHRDAETERYRLDALDEVKTRREQFEARRQEMLTSLGTSWESLERALAAVRAEGPTTEEPSDLDNEIDTAAPEIKLPEQRDDVRTFTISLKPSTNGSTPDGESADNTRQN